jgi:hypothetical protein
VNSTELIFAEPQAGTIFYSIQFSVKLLCMGEKQKVERSTGKLQYHYTIHVHPKRKSLKVKWNLSGRSRTIKLHRCSFGKMLNDITSQREMQKYWLIVVIFYNAFKLNFQCRFTPAFLTPNDTARFHGLNERISVANFNQVTYK